LLLTEKIDGINGNALIWLDKDIRNDIRNYNFIDDSILINKAVLQIIDKNKTGERFVKLENISAAWFEQKVTIQNYPYWRAITFSDNSGWGSYSGTITMYFRINRTTIEWLTDNSTGEEIRLLKSGKSDWCISKKDQGSILSLNCRPDFENRKDTLNDQYQITYIRYRINKNGAVCIKRKENGFWENEDNFPDEDLFPIK
jgi:hypothetical protein